MAKLKIVYMGTPEFAVASLDQLINSTHTVAAVVTQPDRPKGRGHLLAYSPVKEFAVKQGLPVLQPEKITEPGFIAQLAALNPDMIVVVAFGQFLSRNLLDLPPLGCINVHASLLPKYRGAAPIHWAVINGERLSGVTSMFMDVGMDTGDMILRSELPIAPDETSGELHDRLKILGADLLAATLELAIAGRLPRIKQDNDEATYAPPLDRDIERITWHKSAQMVHNLVRGLNPWPGAFCLHRGKVLKVWRTQICPDGLPDEQPGQVTVADADRIVVATGTGSIELQEIQPESKRRMTCGEYMRGNNLNVGEILG